MSFSIFGEDSPRSVQLPDNYLIGRNSPVVVEHNVSYTRLGVPNQANDASRRLPQRFRGQYEEGTRNSQHATNGGNEVEGNGSDEDARFLRLAHEALVATTAKSNMLVDPTIEDLLTRLQYALLPHGNPIKRSQNINTNENGQLMIQNFYEQFPNMSNDIFTSTNNHPLNSDNSGWNFLLDKDEKKEHNQNATQPPELGSQRHDKARSVTNESDDEVSSLDRGSKLQRKFPCPDCNMLFRRSSDLKRHGKQHLEIPANICPSCGKGFARKDALKRHKGTLTCKRNKEKGLHAKNLRYLRDS